MTQPIRSGLLLLTCLTVLAEGADGPGTRRRMPNQAVFAEIARRVALTEFELGKVKTGGVRWKVDVNFLTSAAATVGWMVKRDSQWWITKDGLEALQQWPTPEELHLELGRRYRQIDNRRRLVRKKYESQLDRLALSLASVPEGTWTSHDDLAQLIGAQPQEVADLLAALLIPHSHRVLYSDGRVPHAMHQHATYRGDDLQERLEQEGVEFDHGLPARASQNQHITPVPDIEAAGEAGREVEIAGRRAWLVRGSNVDGVDLVPRWLAEGWVSLAGSQFPATEVNAGQQRLREVVTTAYRHKSYSVREKLVGEFDAFLRQMNEDDYLITVHRGQTHLGLVEGSATVTDSGDRRSNLRRPVRWLNPNDPIDLTELEAPLPTLIQSQDDVVDVTDGLAALDRLYAPFIATPPPLAPPRARLADVSASLAEDLLMEDVGWLRGVRDLLAERRQLILYGPPGTGKTYLAQKLAAGLTESHAVKLVQFHPSYTYEDFFEGFRPESTEDGTLRFRLMSGPLRKLADDAREHPSTAYILIIDEINRGNLAKIFGELYFLLEYRDQRISLQYSQGDFTLPTNLYLIGTMNTADRSIALVDAAMRRRFAFVEMHPGKPPVAGLLRRWLQREGIESDAADVLERLNARLVDADYAIGPSYFMRTSVYEKPDGLDVVWRHDLLPLLVEHHYADDLDVEAWYGLDVLRAELA